MYCAWWCMNLILEEWLVKRWNHWNCINQGSFASPKICNGISSRVEPLSQIQITNTHKKDQKLYEKSWTFRVHLLCFIDCSWCCAGLTPGFMLRVLALLRGLTNMQYRGLNQLETIVCKANAFPPVLSLQPERIKPFHWIHPSRYSSLYLLHLNYNAGLDKWKVTDKAKYHVCSQ